MTIKAGLVSCVTALLGAAFSAGCASVPSQQDTERLLRNFPDNTVTDDKTGCRYMKDDPKKTCLPNDFPRQEIK